MGLHPKILGEARNTHWCGNSTAYSASEKTTGMADMELLLAAVSSLGETAGGADNDLDAAERDVHAVQQLQHTKRSIQEYRYLMVHYLQWMLQNGTKQHLITKTFRDSVQRDKKSLPSRKSILAVLDSAPKYPPLYFAKLVADDFLAWVEPLRRKDGARFVHTTYVRHRSAFHYLCEIYNWDLSASFEDKLSKYFSGLQRKLAGERGVGIEKSQTGKQLIQMRLYRRLSEVMLGAPTRDMIFARAFMLLTWSLMARASSTAAVCFSHLEWGEDALRVYFTHSKTDQLGTRPRDPRHVYANPLQPELCPILALGMFWLCYDNLVDERHLFPGNGQSERFRKMLSRTLRLPEVELENADRVNLGTHSFRKGSSSYAACGSTAAPSATAVHLRAGWSLGAIQNSYLRHVDAGDMHVGRVLSGLPIMQPEFAAPPPHFVSSTAAVAAARSTCFPGLPASASTIGTFVLASLVHYADFLKSRLPANHPVLNSTLFTSDTMLQQLRECLAQPECQAITLTGIPPHVVLQQSLRSLTDDVKSLTGEVMLLTGEIKLLKTEMAAMKTTLKEYNCAQSVPHEGMASVPLVNMTTMPTPSSPAPNSQSATRELPANVATRMTTAPVMTAPMPTSPTPTDSSLMTKILVEFSDLKALLKARPATAIQDTSDTDEAVGTPFEVEIHEPEELPRPQPVRLVGPRRGRLSIFPDIVPLPMGGPVEAWVKWVCGDPDKHFPPYRRLVPDDLNEKDKNRLPDLRFLMERIEARAKQLNIDIQNVMVNEAISIYQRCASSIDVPVLTKRGRKRRRGQLVWQSIVTILREQIRQRQQSQRQRPVH